MGLAQELQQIAQLQLLNDNVDELETANANIYLDSGDINVAQTTLEMLIGGQASVLDTESPHYKSNYIWGTNELLTSIKGSLGTIDNVVDTTVGQEKLKVDIVSATATLEVNTDNLESKIVGITGTDPNFSNLYEVKTSIDSLKGASTNVSTLYDLKQSIDTLATESTSGDIKTHFDNLIYSNGSGYYIQAKDYNVLTTGSDAPANTPFTAIGGVDENDKSRVLKTTTSGELNAQLVTGTNSIGTVGLDAGVNSIGTIGLDVGTNSIGKVGLNAGTQSIGKVGLNAGTQAIGTVEVTSAPTTAVTGTFWQTTQPVSGTFWQTTQPISHDALSELSNAINTNKVDVNLTNSSVAVTGTFWQSTQPVSGTFWQSTQPISHSALTELGSAINASNQMDVNLTNSSVPVTGTFWQTTQPVSIAGTVEVIQDTANDLKVTEVNSSSIKTSVDSIRGVSSNVSSLYDLKGVLDAIKTNTDTIEATIETVEVNTDDLETKVQATNDALTTASTGTNALLTNIKTAVEKIDDSIDGSEMQVDVVSMPTTAVTGSFYPATQPISGTVAVTNSALDELGNAIGTTNSNELDVNIKNSSLAVTGSFYPASQTVSGAVSVTGSVASNTELNVADLDTGVGSDDQAIVGLVIAETGGSEVVGSANPLPVSGAFYPATQPVSGTVTSNVTFPSSQTVDGGASGLVIRQSSASALNVTEANSTAINTSVGSVGTSVDNLKGSGGNLSTLYDLDQELTNIKGFVETTSNHAPKMTSLDTTLTSHTTTLNSIDSDTGNMATSLDAIETAVEVSTSFKNGTETIGTSSGALTSTNHPSNKGVTLSVEMSNLGTIYVGYDSNVTTSNGFPLEAGDSMYIPIDNPNKVYCIADQSGQDIYWFAI